MTDFPDLKLKAQVNFPARVTGGAGIDVDKSNGNYTFDLAFDDFAPPVSSFPPADIANLNGLLWNAATGAYVLAPLTLIGSGGAGITEAPIDGFSYGRNSAAWAKVLPLAGGTLTGPLILNADPVVALGSATKQYVDSHSATLTFETRADAMAANISATANSILIRRYSVGDRLGNAPYVRGAGQQSFFDANGQQWSLDLSGTLIKTSWWGINGISPTVDETAKLQSLANAAGGLAVQIEGIIALSAYVRWFTNTTVFGDNSTTCGFRAMAGLEFLRGLAYVNNDSRIRFLRLAFIGNLVQPAADSFFYGAIGIDADAAGNGIDQIEISDCFFANFRQASWIGIFQSAQAGATGAIRQVKILRNEVYAASGCSPGPTPSNIGNYFVRIHGNTLFDEPSLFGVVSDIVFAQNQIYGLGLAGIFEGLFNQANISILGNVAEFVGNSADPNVRCYGFAVYNSSPGAIDPYNVSIVGNVINGGVNCAVYSAGARHVTVSGNVFRNILATPLAVSLPSGFGIAFNGSLNISCTGNTITGCSGGVYYGQDINHQSTDSISGNTIVCATDANRNATGIMVNPDVVAASTDNQCVAVIANNSVTVSGANATGIQIVGNHTVGRLSLLGNRVKANYLGITGQGIIGVVELIGNSVSGSLANYPYLFSSTSPLIVKGELVDFGDVVAGTSSGASFDGCTNLMLDGMTLLNKANTPGALSMAGSQGTVQNVSFRNCAVPVVVGGTQLGQAKPTFAAGVGNRVQNLIPSELGSAASKYVVDHWINVSGSTTWQDQRMLTGN